MSGLLNLCEKYFGSRDLYEVLKISKDAGEKQVRKAYHKLSLQVHPDRVEDHEKAEATEKFKVLGTIHSILSDAQKKAVYDESGEIDDEGDGFSDTNWQEYWKVVFKEITIQDIVDYEKNYKGSDLELYDLKRAYTDGKGDMDYILSAVPFTNTHEEDRLRSVLQPFIDRKEIPEFEEFTHEAPEKQARRKRKYDKEARMSAQTDEKLKRRTRSAGNSSVLIKTKTRKSTGEFQLLLFRNLENNIKKKKLKRNK